MLRVDLKEEWRQKLDLTLAHPLVPWPSLAKRKDIEFSLGYIGEIR